MRILLTSVGRRSYLVKYFKEALERGDEVHVANSSAISPAFQCADATVVTPLIYDEKYIPFLKKYCVEKKINAIISLFDVDLFKLAKHKSEFEEIGVTVIVSNPDVIEICNDKWKTSMFLQENGFAIPKTYIDKENAVSHIKSGALTFPLIMKPRWGMGSISVFTAENENELNVFYDKINREIQKSYLKYESEMTLGANVLIQEKIYGQEYGLDIINDLNGEFQNCIIKKKIAMRAGETDCAETVEDEQIYRIGNRLSRILQHIGNLDADIFVKDGVIYVLEMNARFGGGYPFSHVAGANVPRAIIGWLRSENIQKEWLCAKNGILAHKDIQLVCIGKENM